MKLIADECVHRRIISALREAGHDVLAIRDISPGSPDDEVMHLASELGRPLITEDRGFGERFFRIGSASAGVILLRLSPASIEMKSQMVVAVLRDHQDEIHGAFATITSGLVRIRRRLT